MLEQFGRARRALAALLRSAEDAIALLPSTEAGLAAIASALHLPRGANVVVSSLEFVGTVLPWRGLERQGVEVIDVPPSDGRILLEDLEAAVSASTAALVISSVQEVNGFRVDLGELSRMCQAADILLIVDAVQHVGPLELDVSQTAVDAVAVGGHKWLCAPFGMGFLYAAPSLWDRLEPRTNAVMTSQPATGGWRAYLEDPARHPLDGLVFPRDARKLELGALGTTLSAAGLAGAAETLLAIGPSLIAERSRALVEATVRALEEAGAKVITPETAPRSSIVTFRSAFEVETERELVHELEEHGVLVSLRFTSGVGGIRVSPFFYNDEDDIARLVAVVGRSIARRARRRRTRSASAE